MTWRDWLAVATNGTLVLLFAVIAELRRRRAGSGRPAVDLFSRPEGVVWCFLIGAVMIGSGAFTVDSPDVQTFLIGLGSSMLGAGMVAILNA